MNQSISAKPLLVYGSISPLAEFGVVEGRRLVMPRCPTQPATLLRAEVWGRRMIMILVAAQEP